MKKISSNSTYFYKRIFPAIWFGFLGVFIITELTPLSQEGGLELSFMIMPIIMAGIGYFIIKKLVFDLMDEVYDAGDCLIVKNAGKEEQINFKDIKNISYSVMINPPRATLILRRETVFGNEITFSPHGNLIPFKKSRDIEELIDRVDRLRS